MIHLRQAVVVEGKYDKIRLSALVDGPIPVSYTHLDVYKRQPCSPARMRSACTIPLASPST